jgi:hypothetical protein
MAAIASSMRDRFIAVPVPARPVPAASPRRAASRCCLSTTRSATACPPGSSAPHAPASRNVKPARHAGCLVARPWSSSGSSRPMATGATSARPRRAPVSQAYCAQIARAADELGYGGVLLPTGRSCEDAWIIAATLVPLTRQLRFWWRSVRDRIAHCLGARDGDARSHVRGTRAHQRRDRRRSRRGRGRRRLPLPRRTVRRHRRLPGHLASGAGGRDRRSRRPPPAGQGCQGPLPARQKPHRRSTSAAHRRPRTSWPPAHGRLPDLGRAARCGGAEDRRHAPARGRARADVALRDSTCT